MLMTLSTPGSAYGLHLGLDTIPALRALEDNIKYYGWKIVDTLLLSYFTDLISVVYTDNPALAREPQIASGTGIAALGQQGAIVA